MLVKGFKDGSNISVVNVLYRRPFKNNENKWEKGLLQVIFKDLDTGELHKQEFVDPPYEYFILKEGVQTVGPRDIQTPIKDCISRVVPESELLKDIAEQTGNMDFYNKNRRAGQYALNKKLHLHSRVRNSDMMLSNNFLYRFSKHYKNESYTPTKAYFDIETDIRYLPKGSDIPPAGSCPVNAISYINADKKTVNVFILLDKSNQGTYDLFKECKNDYNNILNQLDVLLVNHFDKNIYNNSIKGLEFKFSFFENELSMIQRFFDIVHIDKPNFLMAWNISFDLPFLIERIRALGGNPDNIVCHPDFNHKVCNYFFDERNKGEIKKRRDEYNISDYTVYLDQMVQFAKIRKSDKSVGSRYKLDIIGEKVLGVGKLDYSNIARTFREFIEKDFKLFVFYNIIDTLVQKCIEDINMDVDYLVNMFLVNCTIYNRIFNETILHHNRGTLEFYENGYIIGNNFNLENKKKKFPGAFVAKSTRINNDSRIKVNDGIPINLFANLDDYDYASLYPNIIRQLNIALSTLIGYIELPEQLREDENKFHNKYFNRAGRFIDDYGTNNPFVFGYKWLGLGSFEQVYDDVLEYMMIHYGLYIDTTKDDNLYESDELESRLYVKQPSYINLYDTYYRPDKEIVDRVKSINMAEIFDYSALEVDLEDEEDEYDE